MFACLQCRNGEFWVRQRRHTDIYQVDGWIGQQFCQIVCGLHLVHIKGEAIVVVADIAAGGGEHAIDGEAHGIAECGDAGIWDIAIGLEVSVAHEPESDDSDVDHDLVSNKFVMY